MSFPDDRGIGGGERKEEEGRERFPKDKMIQTKPNSHCQARFVLPKGHLKLSLGKIWKVW